MISIVDLSATLRDGMRGVRFETACTVEREGWNARTLHLYSHAGTHMDAQTHFAAGPETIDQIPLSRCLCRAWMATIQNVQPSQLLRLRDLGAIREKAGAGDALLLRTGWSAHLDRIELFRDALPRISEELACWCVENQINILGVEPPSVADVNNLEEVTRIHKILLAGGVTIVEGLSNLDQLPDQPFLFGAFPLKIHDGDGSPCRAFAMLGISPEFLR